MKKIALSTTSLLAALTLSFSVATAQGSNELDTLKKQIRLLEKKVTNIEAKKSQVTQQQNAEIQHVHEEVHRIGLEGEHLKLAQQSTVKAGSMPKSILLPGTDTSIRIHGYLKTDFIAEDRLIGGDASTDFYSNFLQIPLRGTQDFKKGGEIAFTAKETRLVLDTQTLVNLGKVDSRIEGDFYGGDGSYFRLRKAYVRGTFGPHSFLFGRESSLFTNGSGTGELEFMDFGALVGTPGDRKSQFQYGYQIRENVKMNVSVEHPETRYVVVNSTDKDLKPKDANGELSTLSQSGGSSMDRIPNIAAAVRLGCDDRHISLRGVFHQQRFNNGAGVRRQKNGYGLMHTGMYTFANKDNVGYEVTYGNGLGSWMGDGRGVAYNAATNEFILQKQLGVATGVKHFWTEKTRSSLGLGYLRIFNRGFMKTAQVNRWVTDVHVNVVTSPVPNFDIGIEYGFGQRRVEKPSLAAYSTRALVNRFQISAKYTF